ncbi:MAG TPA: hypothetical protein VM328_11540 [Fimbriimonadaceae bacterium]|nr:hypothetical protein [Fimbriimonadaceae bacterium]
MGLAAPYSEALARFTGRPVVTLATGTTCALLGDERTLREFLVADQTARLLRQEGHTVFSLLIDDSYDPLNYRQLRVAVDKDEDLLAQYEQYCGMPIAHVPDPFGCHESLAAHFEDALLARLNALGAQPTIVSTANLYERGLYRPHVHEVLQRLDEVRNLLAQKFPKYNPQKLAWAVCPKCGYIDSTDIERVGKNELRLMCTRCQRSLELPLAEAQVKLNWKLDCALRWKLFNIDAEPFNKAYLEPQAGAFTVAQELSRSLFGGHEVLPLPYGLVTIEKELSYRLLETLPGQMLRSLLTERPTADIRLTRERVLLEASRYKAYDDTSYLDVIKQLLPVWLLTPEKLNQRQRELLTHGMAFSRFFLGLPVRLRLPSPGPMEEEERPVVEAIHRFILGVVVLRELYSDYGSFCEPAKRLMKTLGDLKKPALHRLRLIVGQDQGPSMIRFLHSLPVDYVNLLEYMLRMHLQSRTRPVQAVVAMPAEEVLAQPPYLG